MERIAGLHGHHWMRGLFDEVNDKYLKPYLVKSKARRNMDKSNLVRTANKLAAKDAAAFANSLEVWYEGGQTRHSNSQARYVA